MDIFITLFILLDQIWFLGERNKKLERKLKNELKNLQLLFSLDQSNKFESFILNILPIYNLLLKS